MVGQVVSWETKTTTNKEQHGYNGNEQMMPAYLILYLCTRVVEPPTCKEVHALTHTTVPTFVRYRCRKNNKNVHKALMYECTRMHKEATPRPTQRELTGFLELL